MPLSDVVIVALIGAVIGQLLNPILTARLGRPKQQSSIKVDESAAAKAFAEAVATNSSAASAIVKELLERLNGKEKEIQERDRIIEEDARQFFEYDKRLDALLEDSKSFDAFKIMAEDKIAELGRRVSSHEERLADRIHRIDELERQVTVLEETISRHSTHIVDLQDENRSLKKRVVELECENRGLHDELTTARAAREAQAEGVP